MRFYYATIMVKGFLDREVAGSFQAVLYGRLAYS